MGFAGTLIALIFVVFQFGRRTCQVWRSGSYAHLRHGGSCSFGKRLLIALAILAPVSNVFRASILGAIGCAGLGYVANLALLAKKRIKESEREFL